jgi:hypothetical protein
MPIHLKAHKPCGISPPARDLRYPKKNVGLFEYSPTSPALPSEKCSIKTKMNMEHWWNDTDGVKYSVKTCSSATVTTTNL